MKAIISVKRTFVLITALLLSGTLFVFSANAEESTMYSDGNEKFISATSTVDVRNYIPKVTVDGTDLTFDVPPKNINGRILVPLRKIFETFGVNVGWDDSTKTVTAIKGDTTIVVKINDINASLNGKLIVLDVPAQIFDGRTLVPLRFISESIGCEVDWDNISKTAIITTKDSSNKVNNITELETTKFENEFFEFKLPTNWSKVDFDNSNPEDVAELLEGVKFEDNVDGMNINKLSFIALKNTKKYSNLNELVDAFIKLMKIEDYKLTETSIDNTNAKVLTKVIMGMQLQDYYILNSDEIYLILYESISQDETSKNNLESILASIKLKKINQ